jgi:hypothetical protein
MKSTLITLLACLCTLEVYSQEKTEPYFFIKLYNQISYYQYGTSRLQSNYQFYHRNTKNYKLLNPNFAIQYKSENGNSHEFEFTDLILNIHQFKETDSSYTNIVDGTEKIDYAISFRYEYSPNRSINLNKNLKLNVGYGIQPYFTKTSIKPYVSLYFPESEQFIGCAFFIAPRLTYMINKKFNFDINIPLNLLDVYYCTIEINNPLFSNNQSKMTSINFDGLPVQFNLRMGLTYKI